MKRKRFILNSGHFPILRHQIRWGIIFALSILLIMGYQGVLMFYFNHNNLDISKVQMIISIATLIVGAFILFLQIILIIKNITIIKQIKKEGNYELTSFSWIDGAFVRFIKLMSYSTLIITSMFAFGFMTNVVLEYIYFDKMNFYLPAVLLFLFANNYSCKSFENQILLEEDF